MPRVLVLLLCLMSLSASLPGQSRPSPDDVFPYAFSTDDFDNGLRLITVPTGHPGVVSVYIVVSVGSRDEIQEGRSGFAHFFEHMMFRGSKNFTSAEQARIFKEAGADRNAYTTDDYTCYHTTFSTADLEQVIEVEADRFRFLQYEEKPFRTEAKAILGEYNTSSASPFRRMIELARDTAFQKHTYKHTTLGFLRDIRSMPGMYDYSLEFFRQHYRPDNTTILIVGDVKRDRVLPMVRTHWADWQAAEEERWAPPEPEPKQAEPLRCHVKWPAPISPWLMVSFKGPAFSTTANDMAVLDVISAAAFSENSELYQELFVRERRIDLMFGDFGDHVDPYLVSVLARVKKPEDVPLVENRILETCATLARDGLDDELLERTKAYLRYSFASSLDSPSGIAGQLAGYIARARSIDAVNDVYRMYQSVTSDDVRAVAARYFQAQRRTVTTLSQEPLPTEYLPIDEEPREDPVAAGVIRSVLQPSDSPLVTFRILFGSGSMEDPAGKEGLAYVTAQMLARGSTQRTSYEQIVERLYPMAASIDVQVDKEMTVFHGTVHRDNAEAFYEILSQMLLEPAFLQADLDRVKANTVAFLDNGLRRTDEEELGKEVLYGDIYRGHGYEHHCAGTISSVESLTLDDVRGFYGSARYGAQRVTLGLAGGFDRELASRVGRDLWNGLPSEGIAGDLRPAVTMPEPLDRNRMTIVQKNMTGTGVHFGFPIAVNRSHPDWVALWLARSYLGEHRSENSHLYQRLRELRGLNYGDYAYIEYFPRGPRQFQPDPNLARASQIFQVWLRPVEPVNGPFALKGALFELRKLIAEGMPADGFEATRKFLSKYASLLVQSQERRLGYALDSEYYGADDFVAMVREKLATLTVEEVNRVIREHLRGDRMHFVVVTEDAEGFRDQILGGETPAPLYVSTPSEDVLAEDRKIQSLPLEIAADDIVIVPIAEVFQ